MGIFIFIIAVILLASLEYRADLDRLNQDYERWKKNRK